jgi:hypothetical protein
MRHCYGMVARLVAGLALGAVALACVPGGAAADDSDASPRAPASASCEGISGEKLEFISSRLDERKRHASIWWRGFTGFYAIGTVITAAQAATEGHSGDRAVDIVSSAKAAFGTTRLFFFDRPAALHGADPVRHELPSCDAALARGEELLRQAAKETRSRASWKRHASIVGINALGAVIAGEGWGSREQAWVSAGVGIAVGEVMAWTHPWNGVRDLDEYESRFGAGGTSKAIWQLVPTLNGLMVTAQF